MYLGLRKDNDDIRLFRNGEDGEPFEINLPPFTPIFFYGLGKTLEKNGDSIDDVFFVFPAKVVLKRWMKEDNGSKDPFDMMSSEFQIAKRTEEVDGDCC